MKTKVRLLPLIAGATLTLLTLAGILVVVGVFNESLNWDLFGPTAEAALYGVFGSCIALAGVGVAMTLVLGTQEIVKAFRSLQHQRSPGAADPVPEASRGAYAKYMLGAILFLAVMVLSLTVVNHGVQKHRSGVFKRLAKEQMAHFQPKLSRLLAPLSVPPRDGVSNDLHDLIKTLNDLSFISATTLYLPDPGDPSAMWSYTASRQQKDPKGFVRFFVAKDFEQAMSKGLSLDDGPLTMLNAQTGFTWYYIVQDENGAPLAVLRIIGNSRENFREYRLGS
jgi:hypothetical protein